MIAILVFLFALWAVASWRAYRLVGGWLAGVFSVGLLAAFAGPAIASNSYSLSSHDLPSSLFGPALALTALGVMAVVLVLTLSRTPTQPRGSRRSPSGSPGVAEWIVLVLLPAGGFLLLFGWLVGLLLLWTSSVWTRTEKAIATVALPGGSLVPILCLVALLRSDWSMLPKLLVTMVLIALALLPVAVAVFLYRRASSPSEHVASTRVPGLTP